MQHFIFFSSLIYTCCNHQVHSEVTLCQLLILTLESAHTSIHPRTYNCSLQSINLIAVKTSKILLLFQLLTRQNHNRIFVETSDHFISNPIRFNENQTNHRRVFCFRLRFLITPSTSEPYSTDKMMHMQFEMHCLSVCRMVLCHSENRCMNRCDQTHTRTDVYWFMFDVKMNAINFWIGIFLCSY